MNKVVILLVIISTFLNCKESFNEEIQLTISEQDAFKKAKENGLLVNEGYERCRFFVKSWLEYADPVSGLIPRNLDKDTDIWNAKDAAADNYPFMVLTAAITDKELFNGQMLEMLKTEERLTSRIGALPDTYSFINKGFKESEVNLESILFGSSEYIKDGLLPLTEWLGDSPWSVRMIAILDDIWKYAPVETIYGDIVSTNAEINGEMLQTLSRIYWMTGDQKYLDWAIRLGDYYLLGNNHPTRDFEVLRLRDHGCEVVSGLCELYATLSVANIEKKNKYQIPIHKMLDRILDVGRNEDGLFHNGINPKTGEVIWEGTADNFGYTFNGFYTVYLVDGVQEYKNATIKGLSSLNKKYRNFDWERGSSDGYADAIEGALNLYAREPIASVEKWLDSEIRVMWKMQEDSPRDIENKWNSSGVIEGWHGDGNFARTTIMYNLWKSQGITVDPWRSDMQLGAVKHNNDVLISITVENNWEGILKFDSARHKSIMKMPQDWPRINQFPEWFTVDNSMEYKLVNLRENTLKSFNGKQLNKGIEVLLKKGVTQFIIEYKGKQ